MIRRASLIVALILISPLHSEDLDKQIGTLAAQLGAEKEINRGEPPKELEQQRQLEKLQNEATAPGKEAQRAEYCKAVAKALDGELPAAAKVWLLQSLERAGRR